MASFAVAIRLPILLIRRAINYGRKPSHSKDSDDNEAPPRLCNYDDLPEWYQHQESPYIISSYRPVSQSCRTSILSLTHLHNETLNIYTHLLPALALAFALPLLQLNISSIYAEAPWLDRFMLTLTPLAALLTLTLSSSYHTFCNHSEFVAASCLLLDFTGILVLILTSFITGIYVGFYNHPFEQRVYWTMITLLIGTSTLLVLHPRLQGQKYRPHRTAAFVLTTLSGLGPTCHGLYVHGLSKGWHECGVKWWFAEGLWYGLGVLFFASRFPESWALRKGDSWKGKFDIWGSSHQWFHTCVVLGAACHCWGVWEAWTFAV